MKTKDYIIIGGAVALLLLWQKNRTKKGSTSTTTGGEKPLSGGDRTTLGEGMPTGGGTTTAGTSQVTTFPTLNTTLPEQVFGLGLPVGMDLPILTAGTGVPTEVAVQQGGVSTIPTPAIVEAPVLQTEQSLSLGGIRPIVRTLPLLIEAEPLTAEPILASPYVRPTMFVENL